jgi:hypothetical protein
LVFASAAIIALTLEASTGPVIRIRAPVANSTSIAPNEFGCGGVGPAPANGAIATAENTGSTGVRPQSSCRHRNNWLL